MKIAGSYHCKTSHLPQQNGQKGECLSGVIVYKRTKDAVKEHGDVILAVVRGRSGGLKGGLGSCFSGNFRCAFSACSPYAPNLACMRCIVFSCD